MKSQTIDKINDLITFVQSTTGFPLGEINFVQRNDMIVQFTYFPESKSIRLPYSSDDLMETEKEMFEYSILHEIGHIITDFILSTNININNFTKKNFENNLKKYFNKEIVVTEQEYDCFKNFIREFIHNPKLINAFRFDDIVYIDLNDIGKTFEKETEKYKASTYLYHNNTLEMFSDYFACKIMLEKCTNEKEKTDFEKLAEKIYEHIKPMKINRNIKTKESMIQQIDIFLDNNPRIKKNPFTKAKIKKLANFDLQTVNNELRELINKRIQIYNFIVEQHVEPLQETRLKEQIEQAKQQFQDAKDAYKNTLLTKDFDVIADFIPPPNTYPLPSSKEHIKDPLSQAIWFQNEYQFNTFSKYAVVDPQNLKIYYFPNKPNELKPNNGLEKNIEKSIKAKTDEITANHNNQKLLTIDINKIEER